MGKHSAWCIPMIKDKSIFIKNVYYMLSYAFSVLSQSNFANIAAEEFENIHNLFAAILVKGISQQLKHGLYREYLNKTEDLPVMHGKIDMTGTIKNKLECKQRLTCEYDELCENNLLNQILKTTMLLLLCHSEVDTKYKDALKKEILYFSNVDTVKLTGVHWNYIRFHRNNQIYRMLISICQLIAEGMLLTTDNGEYRLASFFNEQCMCCLYEKFILEYYNKEFPTIKTSTSQISWSLDDGIGTMLPVMQSDIMLSYKNTVLIIDAKYYSHTTQVQYDVHTLHSSNLYQIFTYVKNKDMEFGNQPHIVSGMLLYARTDETVQPDNVYHMSGNKISVKTLDLNQEFKDIAAQLDIIAAEHFGMEILSSSKI
jgi:5-methylcytosine-specific restriction enzyme subunit McrC